MRFLTGFQTDLGFLISSDGFSGKHGFSRTNNNNKNTESLREKPPNLNLPTQACLIFFLLKTFCFFLENAIPVVAVVLRFQTTLLYGSEDRRCPENTKQIVVNPSQASKPSNVVFVCYV